MKYRAERPPFLFLVKVSIYTLPKFRRHNRPNQCHQCHKQSFAHLRSFSASAASGLYTYSGPRPGRCPGPRPRAGPDPGPGPSRARANPGPGPGLGPSRIPGATSFNKKSVRLIRERAIQSIEKDGRSRKTLPYW